MKFEVMHHPDTKQQARVPASAVHHKKAKGWRDGPLDASADTPEPDPKPGPQPAAKKPTTKPEGDA